MTYDPVEHLARCGECYLRTRRDGLPVPPELNERAFAIAVGEAPGATEVTEGRPFVGQSGVELQLSLATLGVRRSDLSYSNALLCKPPGDDLDLILGKFDRENTKLRKAGLAPLPSPLECCKPRLDAELSHYQNVITLGRTAASTVLGGKPSIMAIRGGPITQDNHKIMPVLHPAFVLRMRRWTRAFRADLGRAIRWFHGQSGWVEPRVTINPSALVLERFLDPVRPYGYDVETRPPIPGRPELCLEPLLALLGLFGIAVGDEVMVVSYRSVSGHGQFYSDAELRRIGEVLHAWGVDLRKLKIDFNGYYDGQVIEQQLGFVIAPRLDLALLHRDVEPELPHSLAYVASVYTEIPYAWKVTHAGTDAETDAEWRDYNAKDCVLTFRCTAPLQQAVAIRSQEGPVAMHHAIQRYCMGMHKNGVWVNQAKRAEWDGKLRWVAIGELNKARKALKDSGFADDYARNFNPGSTLQLRSLFFERWGFAPVAYSPKTADPSTNDETLRSLLRDPKLSVSQRAFVNALRRFRVASKERSTYVRRMIDYRELVTPDPLTALVPVEDTEDYEGFASEFDEGTVHKVGRKAQIAAGTYGYVLADGRCHSHFNAHSVTCLVPDTFVLSGNGPCRLGMLGSYGPPQSGTAPDADLRLHDGVGLCPVSHLINVGSAECLELTTALGVRLTGSLKHRVQVAAIEKFRRERPRIGTGYLGVDSIEPPWRWASLDELKPGMHVRIPIGMNAWGHSLTALPHVEYVPRGNANRITLPTRITPLLAYFVGAYIADGSLHDADGTFSIRITNSKPRVQRRLVRVIRRLFGIVNVYPTHLEIKSPALREWAEHASLRRRIENKGAPPWVLRAPWRVVAAYIAGCALDSHFNVVTGVTPEWVYTGTRRLAEEMQMLLLNRGIVATLTDRRYGCSQRTWCCFVRGKAEARKVAEITGQKVPVTPDVKVRSKYVRRGNVVWARVREIKAVGQWPLLDVTVPGTESFWSSGLVSHNTGWRLSSDNPPMQNVPRKLRELWGPQPLPGQPFRVYLSADADQGEMRIISALAGAMKLLEAFRKGLDPHSINATGFFGKGFIQATGKDRDRLRDGAKTFFYAKAYGAADDTVYEAVTSAEDAQGNLPFVNFTLRQVRSALRSWEKENPEIVRWWESEMDLYRSQGFLTDPLFGFRADFLDGEDRQKILNFRSQSLLGAIVQKAAVSLVDGPAPLIPFGRYGHGTGLILNGHDRLDFEWPVFHPRRYADPKKPNVGWCEKGCQCELERVRKLVSDAMYQRVPGLDVQFSGECKVYVGAWA
jgi:uracil-DNA glycosylase